MEEFLKSIPAAASSPYGLAAYTIASILFLFAGYKIRMAQTLMKKITAIPEADRRRALEIAAGTVLPNHITPEEWIRYNRLRWTFLLVASLLIVLFVIATIAILNPTGKALESIEQKNFQTSRKTQSVIQEGVESTSRKIDESTKEILKEISPRTALVVSVNKKGWLDPKSSGRLFEFVLSNPMSGVAIVESISAEVFDVVEDQYPSQEGVMTKFSYSVEVEPNFRGRRTFAEGFKYGSGEADQFSVMLYSSEQGYDYFFRFVVVWHDPLEGKINESYSNVLVARYPSSGIPMEIGDDSVQKAFYEHIEKVRERQAEIEAQLLDGTWNVSSNAGK